MFTALNAEVGADKNIILFLNEFLFNEPFRNEVITWWRKIKRITRNYFLMTEKVFLFWIYQNILISDKNFLNFCIRYIHINSDNYCFILKTI